MTDASTPEPTPGTLSNDVYEHCDPAFLRELQAASGMDDVALARIACLSPAQVQQLGKGGDSLFYSPAIKRQAYRRLLIALGATSPAPPEAAPTAPPQSPTPSQAIENIVALSERKEYLDARPVADTLRGLQVWVGQYRQPLAALVLLLVAVLLFWFSRPGAEVERVAHAPMPAPVATANPLPVEKHEKLPVAPTETAMPAASVLAPVAAPAPASTPTSSQPAVAPVAATGCAYDSSDKRVQVSPTTAQKPGLYVYVVSPTDAEVCVVDGKHQATTLSLRAGEGRSVYGAAPWQLSGSDLGKLQIYFQGWRVTLPEDATRRVTLVEKPL